MSRREQQFLEMVPGPFNMDGGEGEGVDLGGGEGEGVDLGGGEGEGEGVDLGGGEGEGEGEDLDGCEDEDVDVVATGLAISCSSEQELAPVPEGSPCHTHSSPTRPYTPFQEGASQFRREVYQLAQRVSVRFDRLLVKGGPSPKAFKNLASQASRINAMVFLHDCKDADEGRADVLTYAGLVENARKVTGAAEASAVAATKVHLMLISPQVVRPFTLCDLDESQPTQGKTWYEETTKVLQHLRKESGEGGMCGLLPLLIGGDLSKQQPIRDLIESLKSQWPKRPDEGDTINMDCAVSADIINSMIELFSQVEGLLDSQENPHQGWAKLKQAEWEEGSCVQHELVSDFVVAEPGFDASKRDDYNHKRDKLEEILRNVDSSEQKEYFSILLQCAQEIVKKQKIKAIHPHYFSLVMLNCAYVHRMVAIMLQWDGAVIYPHDCGELRRAYDYAFRFCSLREPLSECAIDNFPDYLSALIGVPSGRALIIAKELEENCSLRFSVDHGLYVDDAGFISDRALRILHDVAAGNLIPTKGRILAKERKLIAGLTDFQVDSARYIRINGVIDTPKSTRLLQEQGVSSEVRRMTVMFDKASRLTCDSPAVCPESRQRSGPVFIQKAAGSLAVTSKVFSLFREHVVDMGVGIEICRAEHLLPLFRSSAFLECEQSSLLISIDNQNFNVWTSARKNYFATLCSAAKLIKEAKTEKKIDVIVTAGLQQYKLFPQDLIPMDKLPGAEIMLQGEAKLNRLQLPTLILSFLKEKISNLEVGRFRELVDDRKKLTEFNDIMCKIDTDLQRIFQQLRYCTAGEGEVDKDVSREWTLARRTDLARISSEMLSYQRKVSERVMQWSKYEEDWITGSRVRTLLKDYFNIKRWEQLDVSNKKKFDSLLFENYEGFKALYPLGHCPFSSKLEFDMERQRYVSALITSAEEYFERTRKNGVEFDKIAPEDQKILFYANCVYLHEEVSVLSAVKGAVAYPSPSAALTYAIRFSQLRPKQDVQLTGASYLRLLLQIDRKRAGALLTMLVKNEIFMTYGEAGTPLCEQELKKGDDFLAVRKALQDNVKLNTLAKGKKQITGGVYPADIDGLLTDSISLESVVRRGFFFTNFSPSVRDLKTSAEVDTVLQEFDFLRRSWEPVVSYRGKLPAGSPDTLSSAGDSESSSPSDIPAVSPSSNSPAVLAGT